MARPFIAELAQAAAHLDANRIPEAEQILDPLLAKAPLDPYVLYNCALARTKAGRRDEAIMLYRKAIGADPDMLPALVNLGQSLIERGDHREALRYVQMAARRQPHHPHVLGVLSAALIHLGNAKDALEAAEDGLRVEPQHLALLIQRMYALNDLNRHPEALDAAFKVIAHPNGKNYFDAYGLIIYLSAKRSDWDTLAQHTPHFLELARQPDVILNPLQLTGHSDDPELIGQAAHRRASKMRPPPSMPRRPLGDRIVVAYLSPDLREHPVAHMLLDVLPHHDRQKFEIYTIGTVPNDLSPLSAVIGRFTDGHIDLTSLDDSAAARELRLRNVDVLVDLAGSTKWCRPELLAKRVCPVQALWLGCPCSTGTPYYDAYLVDDFVAPPGYDAYCSEPLVRLPCCYHPISTGHGTPTPGLTRADYGLPADPLIVGLLQQPTKIRPPLVDRIASALAPYPQAHLWIRIHPDCAKQDIERLGKAGLPPERIHICPLFSHREHYLAMYGMADILVDSFPYGGHSTTGEALIQGSLVLTMAGRSIHSRVAASMLHQMGLDDVVQPDLDALERTLRELIVNPTRLDTLKQRFQTAAAKHRLTGSQTLARALEASYRDLLLRVPQVG